MNELIHKLHNEKLHVYLQSNVTETLIFHDLHLELTAFDSLTVVGKSILIGSLMISLIVGSYFKSALHFFLWDERHEILDKPIDLLILFQALTEHLVSMVLTGFYVIGVTFNITFADYFGETWCNLPFYASSMGVANRISISLGIAILRMFYVKFPYKVKDDRFRRLMTFVTLTICIACIILGGIGFGRGNGPNSRKQVLWNFCIGQSEKFREVVHNYSMAVGSTKAMSDIFPTICSILTLAFIFSELACYILLFRHLYKHNEDLLRKKTLPAGEIRRRHRQNAMSFVGQFYGFVVRTMLTIGCLITLIAEPGWTFLRMVVFVFVWVEFGIIAIVEVMTSVNIYNNLPHRRFSN